ncbi:MAG: ABC transporter substrate-binding protein [SAR92 clade bacterium]|uniref:ABC transporter substrate-binding protein n=1 Tax=SAR92 clade bacterium TaxID=2315479 RepID=A0A520MHQ4_9GAMM|nr:MAG: ABC transporter substrate-binding protein [SAR92 clade bacterium]
MNKLSVFSRTLGLCLVILSFSPLVGAQMSAQTVASKQDPFDNIETMTSELLTIIADHKGQYPRNEKSYFSALNNLMTPFVDFDYVAKKVMGKKYVKLSTREQRDRFVGVFREGLVETYGRGLMSYGDEKIVLVNRQVLPDEKRVVIVKQEIRGATAVYPLNYLMAKKRKTGEWNVVNVTLNGINLSKTFSSQFQNAARKSSDDIDKVIDGWLISK